MTKAIENNPITVLLILRYTRYQSQEYKQTLVKISVTRPIK